MFPYLILGIALLAGLLLAGRWFVSADPKTLAKVLKWLLFGVIGAVILFFLLTGRLAWAFYALPALLPWFVRARSAHRAYKTFSRMYRSAGGANAATGQTSDVDTRFLRMTLDHDTGEMSGEVKEGAFAGRRIETLGVDELVELLRACWTEDQQSAQVLETYLNRVHPDWREQAQAGAAGEGAGGGSATRGGAMSRAEALDVLGLKEGATEAEIRDAHHRLIAGLHPDHGGSTYLAAKINQARDVLVGG
ncbi:MAG: molecular chaperone DnaJ [Rhodospirillales bacterium]|nr:molecular chaperone DnaJ [Rhodospirillales bacterium]